MVTLSDISNTIHLIKANLITEAELNDDAYLCENYNKATDLIKEAHESHKTYAKMLIAQINEYIDYPIEKKIFFERRKATKLYKEYSAFDRGFWAYKIIIPPIDKQEYYCIRKILKENHDVVVMSNDEYYILK